MNGMTGVVRRLVPRGVRNWIRSPARSLAWLADRTRHAVGWDATVEVRPGWHVRSHPAALRTAYAPQFADPAQAEEMDAFIACCRPDMTLFDLGAHFGLFSLAALHYGGPGARAIAVDPSPAAQRMMRIQAGLNGATDRMQLIRAGVSDRTGRIDFVSVGVIAAGYYTAPEAGHSRRERTTVEAVTVDDLVQQGGSTPSHIKIDVEGFEAAALRGAHRTLRAQPRPLVFLEVHVAMMRDRGQDPAEPLTLLESAGFDTFATDGTPLAIEAVVSRPLVRLVARPRGER